MKPWESHLGGMDERRVMGDEDGPWELGRKRTKQLLPRATL
jgi:hypothetical protein